MQNIIIINIITLNINILHDYILKKCARSLFNSIS